MKNVINLKEMNGKMDKEAIMKAVEGALKDHGVDWILNEWNDDQIDPNKPFKDLMGEIELAVSKVIK